MSLCGDRLLFRHGKHWDFLFYTIKMINALQKGILTVLDLFIYLSVYCLVVTLSTFEIDKQFYLRLIQNTLHWIFLFLFFLLLFFSFHGWF